MAQEQTIAYEPPQMLCVVLNNVDPSEAGIFTYYSLGLIKKNLNQKQIHSESFNQEHWFYALPGSWHPSHLYGRIELSSVLAAKSLTGAKAAFSTTTCKYCFGIVIFLVVDPINPLSSGCLLSFGKCIRSKIFPHNVWSGIYKSDVGSGKDFFNILLWQDYFNTFPGRAYRVRREKD